MIGIDTETTGTNPATSRIVELALEIMTPDKPTKEWRTLVNPGMPIPANATAVHHITDEMVKDAPSFGQLADNLLKGFAGADFCGYNVRFDLRMLGAEFKRNKRSWDYEDARVIDGFRLWQIAEGRSLEDAVKRWAGDTDEAADGQAHAALWDVKMSTRVIASQLKTSGRLPRDVQQLHELCSPGWFDAEGKLQWREGELCLSFGQHRDISLKRVPKSYLDWITKGDFSAKVKDVCRDAMRGVFPPSPEVL